MSSRKRKKKSASQPFSRLGDQKKIGTRLISPLAATPAVELSSWRDERLPELLWAALLTAQMQRGDYLDLFRRLGESAAKYSQIDARGMGHSKFAELSEDEFDAVLEPALEDKYLHLYEPLALFPGLPDVAHWRRRLANWDGVGPGRFEQIAAAIGINSWHQSESATDIRWLRVLTMIRSGHMIFGAEMKEHELEILEYPNRGDLRAVRPSIRASEMAFATPDEEARAHQGWISHFWQTGKSSTNCVRIPPRKNRPKDHSDLFSQATHIYENIAEHFHNQESYAVADARLDASFGIVLYAVNLFLALLAGRSSKRVEGRMLFRTLVELYVTLAYLAKVDNETTWTQYRTYGHGQARLAYLKMINLESEKRPEFVTAEDLEELANEDRWQEFVDVELGSWAKRSLRDMSEKAGVKDVYDRYYGWPSGYVHGHWSAVRDTVFDLCANPLHRFHRIPSLPRTNFDDTANDAISVINLSLDLLNQLYPPFKPRLKREKRA